MSRINKAFTLAEVLITLLIIGVVASLVIPAIINDVQKKDIATALQKAYSVGNQALSKAALDNCGGTDISCIFGNLVTSGDAIVAQYKVVKNCKNAQGLGCGTPVNQNYDGTHSHINYNDDDINAYKFITSDGMIITIFSYNNNCTRNYGFRPNSPTAKTCGAIHIDVNGLKGPNNRGRDVFRFYIVSNKVPLYPYGGQDDNFDQSSETVNGSRYWNHDGINMCSPNYKDGWSCPGRIMEKGWTIDY